MTRHLLIAATCHDDGSRSSRVWVLTDEQLDALTQPAGPADYLTHIPAEASRAVQPAMDELRAGSVVVRHDRS